MFHNVHYRQNQEAQIQYVQSTRLFVFIYYYYFKLQHKSPLQLACFQHLQYLAPSLCEPPNQSRMLHASSEDPGK